MMSSKISFNNNPLLGDLNLINLSYPGYFFIYFFVIVHKVMRGDLIKWSFFVQVDTNYMLGREPNKFLHNAIYF